MFTRFFPRGAGSRSLSPGKTIETQTSQKVDEKFEGIAVHIQRCSGLKLEEISANIRLKRTPNYQEHHLPDITQFLIRFLVWVVIISLVPTRAQD